MGVDVAVEEPRTRVVGPESDSDVVASLGCASGCDVAEDGVFEVVLGAACAAYDSEGVLLSGKASESGRSDGIEASKNSRREDGTDGEHQERRLTRARRFQCSHCPGAG